MQQLKRDIKSGMSKEEAFDSYKQRGGENTKRASMYLAYRSDPQLLKKYSIANYVLIFLFSLRTLTIALTGLTALASLPYWGVPVLIIELGLYIAVLYFLWKGNAGAYFAVLILTLNPLMYSIGAFLNESSMATIASMIIFALVFVLAIYIKLKLFPFQSFLHTKKDVDGNSVFSSIKQDSQVLEKIMIDTVPTISDQVDAPQNTSKRTKLLFITTVIVVVMFIAFKFYSNAQQNAKYEAEDARERQFTPDLQIELKSLTNKDQSEVIEEYRHQGLNLRCFSNLRPEEKISQQDDYLCWAVTKNIFNIPSRNMAIFFSEKKLTNVRLEFPESSFNLVQSYLNTTLGEKPRLDLIPGDTIDSSIMSWKVDHGIVNTNKNTDDKILITWSSEKVLSPEARKEFKNIH
ncbi:hypothetical protein [Sulfuricurvum sp.]|uniref:hypothetical protein n=1 Tax=Sulfuricurvum sp. TaxID=2025608 RepID=UPI0026206B29|nr:hypothetical protein [Sulfuricurvum sp.]MDD3598032.1 hypothetical protein [Sulfuricurvum sp.]